MIRTITTPAGKVYHPGHTYRTEDGRRVYVYWSVRNGKLYGPVRHAVEGSGVVFAAIAAAIEEAHAEALELNEADDRLQALRRAFWARHRVCCARGPFKDTLYGPELVECDHAKALTEHAARGAGWVCMACGARFANIGDHDTEACAQEGAWYARHRDPFGAVPDHADMIEADHAEALMDDVRREVAQVRARAQASGQNAAAYASHRFCSHEPDGRSLIECDHAEALEDEAVREAAKARAEAHVCPWCKAPHGPSEAEREAALRASLDVDAEARIERAEAALIEAAEEAHAAERERLHSEQLDAAERERPGLLSPGLLDEADEILTAATVYVRHYPARRYRHMGAGI